MQEYEAVENEIKVDTLYLQENLLRALHPAKGRSTSKNARGTSKNARGTAKNGRGTSRGTRHFKQRTRHFK